MCSSRKALAELTERLAASAALLIKAFFLLFFLKKTRDYIPFATLNDALAFRAALGGEAAVMAYNHALAASGGAFLCGLWGDYWADNGLNHNNDIIDDSATTQSYPGLLAPPSMMEMSFTTVRVLDDGEE
jgi:hypothetical protein